MANKQEEVMWVIRAKYKGVSGTVYTAVVANDVPGKKVLDLCADIRSMMEETDLAEFKGAK